MYNKDLPIYSLKHAQLISKDERKNKFFYVASKQAVVKQNFVLFSDSFGNGPHSTTFNMIYSVIY